MSRWVPSAAILVGLLSVSAHAQPPEPDWPFPYSREHQRIFHFLLSDWPEQAIERASEFLSRYSDDAESYYMLALGQAQRGNMDDAAEAMKRAIELNMPASRFLAGPKSLVAPLSQHPAYQELESELGEAPVHGPMIGALTESSVRVWVRTVGPAEVNVRVWPAGDESAVAMSPSERTTAASDYTAVLHVTGLQAATDYKYGIIIDGTVTRSEDQRFRTMATDSRPDRFSVAFGGGAQYLPEYERIWDVIGARQPRALLMLGDNVYIDDPWRLDMQRYCYYRRQSRPEWRRLVSHVPVYSIWDDHDFSVNDGWGGPEDMLSEWYNHDRKAGTFGNGKYFPQMAAIKPGIFQVFRQNWANPGYGAPLPEGGCWYSFEIDDVDFFMLDCRWFRTDPRKDSPTMLGPTQKTWLKEQIRKSDKAFKVIASSVPWDFDTKGGSKDTWNGYRDERNELFSFLEAEQINGVILLSADRHRSDAIKIPRTGSYDLYDLMSSHLTKPDRNSHATIDHALFSYNKRPAFGFLTFDMSTDDPTARYQIINIDNESVYSLDLPLSALQ